MPQSKETSFLTPDPQPHAGRSLSSLCRQQALSSQAGCPQRSGPPETLSPETLNPKTLSPETLSPKTLSPRRAENISREGRAAGPVPEGRGGDMGVKELCTVFAWLLGGPPASGGPSRPTGKEPIVRNQISSRGEAHTV